MKRRNLPKTLLSIVLMAVMTLSMMSGFPGASNLSVLASEESESMVTPPKEEETTAPDVQPEVSDPAKSQEIKPDDAGSLPMEENTDENGTVDVKSDTVSDEPETKSDTDGKKDISDVQKDNTVNKKSKKAAKSTRGAGENTHRVIYDANGGSFADNATTNEVDYDIKSTGTVVYSHTPNVNDEGVQSGRYGFNLRLRDVVTIPGAESIHVRVRYGTEERGCLYIFEGDYEGEIRENLTADAAYSLSGHDAAPETVDYEIPGDTATFVFYSGGSIGTGSKRLGYYAVVTESLSHLNNTEYKEPTAVGQYFNGWNTKQDGSGTQYVDETAAFPSFGTQSETTLYAQWYTPDASAVARVYDSDAGTGWTYYNQLISTETETGAFNAANNAIGRNITIELLRQPEEGEDWNVISKSVQFTKSSIQSITIRTADQVSEPVVLQNGATTGNDGFNMFWFNIDGLKVRFENVKFYGTEQQKKSSAISFPKGEELELENVQFGELLPESQGKAASELASNDVTDDIDHTKDFSAINGLVQVESSVVKKVSMTNCRFYGVKWQSLGSSGCIWIRNGNDARDVRLTNCTAIGIRNGRTFYVGGRSASVTVDNCIITDCTSGSQIYSNAKTFTASNCTFTRLSAGDGPAIYAGCGLSDSVATIENCDFTDCTATSTHGGAVRIGDNVNIAVNSSSFTHCTAQQVGGAIYQAGAGNVSMMDTTFTDCTGTYGSAFFSDGTSNTREFLFERCNFLRCNASNGHGAICERANGYYTTGALTTVRECSFTDCTAKNYSAALIIRSTNVKIEDCDIIRCCGTDTGEEGSYGNAAWISNCGGDVSIVRTIFDNNGKGQPDGGIFRLDSAAASLTIEGCEFKNGKSVGGTGGGAIRAQATQTTFKASKVPEGHEPFNTGTAKGKTEGTVIRTTFTDCTSTAGSGGAAYITGNLAVSGTDFNNCSARYNGGALYTTGNTVFLDDVVIDGCTAATSGGIEQGCAVDNNDETTLTLKNTQIKNCTTTQNDSAAVKSSARITELNNDLYIRDNTAKAVSATTAAGMTLTRQDAVILITGQDGTANIVIDENKTESETDSNLRAGFSTPTIYVKDLNANGGLTGSIGIVNPVPSRWLAESNTSKTVGDATISHGEYGDEVKVFKDDSGQFFAKYQGKLKHRLIWAPMPHYGVCKITDEDRNVLYYDFDSERQTATFDTLEDAIGAIGEWRYDDSAFTSDAEGLHNKKPANIEMLVENYTLDTQIQISNDVNGKHLPITIRTAEKNAADGISFQSDETDVAMIRRGSFTASMFVLDAEDELVIRDLILDSHAVKDASIQGDKAVDATQNGSIVRVTSANALLSLKDGAVLQNTKQTGSFVGGAVYITGGGNLDADGARFVNCQSSTANSGGAIYINGNTNSSLIVKNCYFLSCSAKEGGAIYNNNDSLQIEESRIDACSATTGGGIFNNACALKLKDTTIENCTATNGGGIYTTGNAELDHSVIQNCSASATGGGIYSTVSLHLYNDTMIVNNRHLSPTAFNAGGVHLTAGTLIIGKDTITEDKTSVTGNTSNGKGKANVILPNTATAMQIASILTGEIGIVSPISANKQFGTKTVGSGNTEEEQTENAGIQHITPDISEQYKSVARDNDLFWIKTGGPVCKITDENRALLTYNDEDAVFYSLADAWTAYKTLPDAKNIEFFKDCYEEAQFVVTQDVTLRTAKKGDGAYDFKGNGNAVIHRGAFLTNMVNMNTNNVTLTLHDITLDGGSEEGMQVYGSGGLIAFAATRTLRAEGQVILQNTDTYLGNYSSNSGAISGAGNIVVPEGASLTFSRCTASNYYGSISYGAIIGNPSMADNAGTIRFVDCSAGGGGAIGGNPNMANNSGTFEFIRCGHAIYGSPNMSNNTGTFSFTECESTWNGAAIGGSPDMSNNSGTFEFNRCKRLTTTTSGGGGAIAGSPNMANNSGTFSFKDCSSAFFAGAINGSPSTDNNTGLIEFLRCEAESSAGAITDGSSIRNNHGTIRFEECKAGTYGGAISLGGYQTIANGEDGILEFKGCTAGNNGGAIYNGTNGSNVGTLTITNSGTIRFEKCKATNGGGIASIHSEITNAEGAVFEMIDCSATESGGALVRQGNNNFFREIITNAGTFRLKGCKAVKSGGAFAISSFTLNNAEGSHFEAVDCSSNNSGGAINASTVTITNPGSILLKNCKTGNAGGAFAVGDLTVNDSHAFEVIGCESSTTGGGIHASNLAFTNNGNLRVVNNEAGTNGGGIYSGGVTTFKNSGQIHFSDSEAKNGGGLYSNGVLTFENKTGTINFNQCIASGNGGAVYSNNAILADSMTSAANPGWSCDKDYYIDKAGWIFNYTYKTNDYPAIFVNRKQTANIYHPLLLSTIPEAVEMLNTANNNSKNGSFEYMGQTWYYNDCNYTSSSVNTDYPITENLVVIYTMENLAKILEDANVVNTETEGVLPSTASFMVSDCSAVNGGGIYLNGTSTLAGVEVTGCKADLGSAIYIPNSRQLTILGGDESKDPKALITQNAAKTKDGGAINMGGTGSVLRMDGNVVIKDNTSDADSESNPHNVVLQHNTTNSIQTTSVGLGKDADIGIYVTDAQFEAHGEKLTVFGKHNGGTENLQNFTNDRISAVGGEGLNGQIAWTTAYTLILDPNGAEGEQIVKNLSYFKEVSLANPYSKAGYHFLSWNTRKDGSGRTYYESDVVFGLTEEDGGTVRLYAQWEDDQMLHVLYFHPEGGKVTVAERTVRHGDPLGKLPEASRKGYVFEGWRYLDDNAELKYNEDTEVIRDMHFYAKWKKMVKITFDAAGGVIGEPEREMIEGKIGTLPITERGNWTFDGWYDESGNEVTANTEFTEDATLTAHWKIRLRYDSCDGMPNTDLYSPWQYESDDPEHYVLPVFPELTNHGYTLAGWYTENEGGEEKAEGETLDLTQTNVLYARWTKGEEVTVMFDSNGGSACAAITLFKGDKIAHFPKTMKDGFDFTGWFDEDGHEVTRLTPITEDMTLTAKWTEQGTSPVQPDPETVTVTFDGNELEESFDVTVEKGKGLFYIPGMTRTGYVLEGWYPNADGSGDKLTTETVFSANKIYYAKWKSLTEHVEEQGIGYDYAVIWTTECAASVSVVDDLLHYEFGATAPNKIEANARVLFTLANAQEQMIREGAVKIRIPKQVYDGISGGSLGTNDVVNVIPKYPNKRPGFAWSYIDDESSYVLINNTDTNGSLSLDLRITYTAEGRYVKVARVEHRIDAEAGIDVTVVNTTGFSPRANHFAIEIDKDLDGTADLTKEKDLYTEIYQTDTYKADFAGGRADMTQKWNAEWGEEPADSDDYFYVKWSHGGYTGSAVSAKIFADTDKSWLEDPYETVYETDKYAITKHPYAELTNAQTTLYRTERVNGAWDTGESRTKDNEVGIYLNFRKKVTTPDPDEPNKLNGEKTIHVYDREYSAGQDALLDGKTIGTGAMELAFSGPGEDNLRQNEGMSVFSAAPYTMTISDGNSGDLTLSSTRLGGTVRLGDNDYRFTSLSISLKNQDGYVDEDGWQALTSTAYTSWAPVEVWLRRAGSTVLYKYTDVHATPTIKTISLPSDTVGYELRYSTTYWSSLINVYQGWKILPSEHIQTHVGADYRAKVSTTFTNTATFKAVRDEDGKTLLYKKSSASFYATKSKTGLQVIKSAGSPVNHILTGTQTIPIEVLATNVNTESYVKPIYAGTYYELLPYGTSVDETTVKAVAAGKELSRSCINVEFVENWKDTENTMMIVSVGLPDSVRANSIRLRYDLENTYENIYDRGRIIPLTSAFANTTKVKIPYELAKQSKIGSISGAQALYGELETTYGDYIAYAGVNAEYAAINAFSWGFEKMAETTGRYTDKTYVMPGQKYTYRMTFSQSDITYSKNLVIYDVLESGSQTDESQWNGTLLNVDTSCIEGTVSSVDGKVCKPVIYYATKDRQTFTNADLDITNTEIWSKDMPDDEITAIAVDCSKAEDGEPFLMEGEHVLDLYISIRAPREPQFIHKDTVNEACAIVDTHTIMDAGEPVRAVSYSQTKLTMQDALPEITLTSEPESGTEESPCLVAYDDTVYYDINVANTDNLFVYHNIRVEDAIPDEVRIESDQILVYTDDPAQGVLIGNSPRAVLEQEGQELAFTVFELLPGENLHIRIPCIVTTKEGVFTDFAQIMEVNGQEYLQETDVTWHEVKKYPVSFRKLILDTETALADCQMEVRDSSGIPVESWTTDTSAHEIRLGAGEYRYIETIPAENYAVAKPVAFQISRDGILTIAKEEQAERTVTMYDKYSAVDTTITNHVTGEGSDPNKVFTYHAVFEGLLSSHTYRVAKGEESYAVTSDRTGYLFHEFVLKDGESLVFKEFPSGADLTVTQKGTEYDASYTMKRGGSVLSEKETSLPPEDLETEALTLDVDEGPAQIDFNNTLDTSDNVRVRFLVIDKETEEPVEGADFTVADGNGFSECWSSMANYKAVKLPKNKEYTVTQDSVPEQYFKMDAPFALTVSENGEVTCNTGGILSGSKAEGYIATIRLIKRPVVAVRNLDSETDFYAAGAKLELRKNTRAAGNLEEEWTSGEEDKPLYLDKGATYRLIKTEAAPYHKLQDPSEVILTVDEDGHVSADPAKTAKDGIVTLYDDPDYPELFSLTVSNTVSGNMGSRDKDFAFTVTFSGQKIRTDMNVLLTTATGTEEVNLTPEAEGVYTFSLKHGDSITFNNLIENTEYRITEEDNTYTKSYRINNGVEANGGDTGVSILQTNTQADIYNRLNIAIPTSRRMLALIAIIAGVLLAGLCGTLYILFVKRRKKCESN